jgi:ribose/xylose/arabinose/galactoside ABC-type transport system permease subunit|tara:strand:- start:500 stop:1516 length:1017 start_codon:yes stop_codon:yes gene_type:complete
MSGSNTKVKTGVAGRADGTFSFEGLGLTVVLLGIIVIFSFINPRFFAVENFLNILTQAAPFIIMAVGMTFVITAAGIDLSVGSILALSSVIGFEFMSSGGNPVIGVAIILVVAVALGILNGALIAYLAIPPFIATLATMVSLRGLALLHSAGTMHFGLPESVAFLGQGKVLGLPMPVLIALLAALFGYWLLNFTKFGVYCRALGGNKEALRLTGVSVKRVELLVYGFMGLMVGLGGLVMIARIDSTQATIGTGSEIHVIAAVIIGGTSLFGGKGTVYGSVAGAILLSMVANALVIGGADFFWQLVVTGIIVLFAVLIGNLREGRVSMSKVPSFLKMKS